MAMLWSTAGRPGDNLKYRRHLCELLKDQKMMRLTLTDGKTEKFTKMPSTRFATLSTRFQELLHPLFERPQESKEHLLKLPEGVTSKAAMSEFNKKGKVLLGRKDFCGRQVRPGVIQHLSALGCTVEEIRQLTSHSDSSLAIKRNYLRSDRLNNEKKSISMKVGELLHEPVPNQQ